MSQSFLVDIYDEIENICTLKTENNRNGIIFIGKKNNRKIVTVNSDFFKQFFS